MKKCGYYTDEESKKIKRIEDELSEEQLAALKNLFFQNGVDTSNAKQVKKTMERSHLFREVSGWPGRPGLYLAELQNGKTVYSSLSFVQ